MAASLIINHRWRRRRQRSVLSERDVKGRHIAARGAHSVCSRMRAIGNHQGNLNIYANSINAAL